MFHDWRAIWVWFVLINIQIWMNITFYKPQRTEYKSLMRILATAAKIRIKDLTKMATIYIFFAMFALSLISANVAFNT